MKKLLIIALILSSVQLFAQTNEGIVHYTRTTYWTKMNNQLSYLSKQEKERMTYMFAGKDDWKVYTTLYFNENESRYIDSDEKPEEDEGYAGRKEEFSVNRNFAKNTMTDVFEMLGKTYIIEDSLQMPNWKILNDIKEVAGHICMKAMIEDPIKNQKIIAWFAQDIPINAGPERLWGLPGLILELDINDGTVTIIASKIEFKKLNQELALPKKLKGKKITEAEYKDMQIKFIKEKIKEERNPFWFLRY
ncbi:MULTISPECIES: GLPGLI family protein [unclassified Arcicella]|uniref:GLPGLI family protein n=1 Tax=unclassified Arcicella TaxID=2644986 RepID=UPI0028662BD5|nr:MULTISPECIES: GLPGLI family protein [unclassified Arcicella]MDR6560946.1 GLPGLI family protein [Arcicella sp. BE51]MDR6810830.1 GLPGLI family protein [Arcicella sp. BE140]MDR6822180.1 GLPGLI family protein [Arcicella sp. BE139]